MTIRDEKPLPADFPKTAADWERVIAAAPGELREPTAEEQAQMARSVVVYSGGFAAVRDALARRKLAGTDMAGHAP